MTAGANDHLFVPRHDYRSFTIRSGPNESHVAGLSSGYITKADLERPSCGACYRPIREGFYCSKCLSSGAATRHRMNPHRLGAPE